MPYKDLETRKLYHRDYYREYMKNKGLEIRRRSDRHKAAKIAVWKEDALLDYKLHRIQKTYGIEGLRAFERDMFCCSVCGEWDIRVLEMHELRKPFLTASNLLTLCANCHRRVTTFPDAKEINNQKYYDSHFMRIAEYYGSHSRCFSRKIGCVIVQYDTLNIPQIKSYGRNGPPIGYPHCNTRNPNGEEDCPRRLLGYPSGEGLHMCPAVHAEMNAINFAAREGHSVDNGVIYLSSPVPCRECAKSIINAGIVEVVVPDATAYDNGGITGLMLLKGANVEVREYLTNRQKCASM